jgi:hypothetical protein
MSAAADSSRRLERLVQIFAESKAALGSRTERDTDPSDLHRGIVPLERISRLTSELRHGAPAGSDAAERLATRLLLNDYTGAVAQLRATVRRAEQRVAEAEAPIRDMRLRIRRRRKRLEGVVRKQKPALFMNHPSRPYLSVVMASRNDGYTGGMLRRLQLSVNAYVSQMERFDLASELVLVDWNPPAGKPLSQALEWPAVMRRCSIRIITVPPQLHASLPFADRLPILIHRARNVGIRRARGEFILPTSPDILFSNELAQWFARRELDPACMYRVARRDVPEEALRYASTEKRLRYCRKHVQKVHPRAASQRIEGLPHLFTNGAGDFTLLSRDMYFKLHGIPEEREFHSMHFDSVLCFMAYAAGARETELDAPLRIYHIDHGVPSWRGKRRWLERFASGVPNRTLSRRLVRLARRLAPPRSALDRSSVPHLDCSTPTGREQYEEIVKTLVQRPDAFQYNDADWGLAQHTLEEQVIAPALLTS